MENSTPEVTSASATQEGLPSGDIGEQKTTEGSTDKASTKKEPEKKKFKAKVNGRDVEVDEDTLVKNWQKYEAADEKFRAAAEKEKKYGKYVDLEKALQNKDLSVLSKYVDPETIRQFSEKQLLEFLEYQGLTDEQKEHLETKRKLEEYENEKRQREADQERLLKEQTSAQAMQLIDEEIANTFNELGEKPTPAKIIRMAMHMSAGLSQKEPIFVSGKEALRRANVDLKNDLTGYLESVNEKELANILPKRVIDAIRRQSVEEATQAPFARSRSQENQNQSSGKIRATTDDFFKQLDQKYQRR